MATVHSGPLEKSGKLLLILSATATILTCYLFSLVSIALLLIWILFEIVAFLILMRFGLGSLVVNYIHRHITLVGIFVRNLWLPKHIDYHMPLSRNDAPELYSLLDSLASHLKVRPPNEVRIEMNCGAWVRLFGLRSGAGKTVLGIGYDLLAALNLSELEGVMAHEMAHAKLVKRGLKSWLNGGLARIARVSDALGECVTSYRAQKQSFAIEAFFRSWSNAMTRMAARLVSAYSRQDEFEADRGAAELCGAKPLRTSLLRLNILEPKLARLPWAERIGRAETEMSFSRWLADELHVPESDAQLLTIEEARDPYSTHPSLADRLAALPAVQEKQSNTSPAISLLLKPDEVAAALIEEVHRIVAIEEQKDTKALAKLARRGRASTALNLRHIPSLTLFVIAVFVALLFFVNMAHWWFLPASLLVFAIAFWSLRLARFRDRYTLPVPHFAELKKAWQSPAIPDLQAQEKELENEFKTSGWGGKKKKVGVNDLIQEAFAAMGRCEYLRAHVATRIALQMNNKSVEAALGNAIASASLHMNEQVGSLLAFVRSRSALSSPQTLWGAAWACILVGDWDNAEAYLLKKQREVPNEPTFLLLLALAQKNRGKLQSAIDHAEKAVSLSPNDTEAAKLLCQCLLDAGRPRAAAEQLGLLESQAKTDPELAMAVVRLRLLQKNSVSAQEWAGHLRQASDSPFWLLRLGGVFESARMDDLASNYYLTAITQGYYPEARLGLGRICARRQDWLLSRQHFLTALNMEKELPPGATGAVQLFPTILGQLMQLERSREECRAWIVSFPTQPSPATPPALRGCRIMVYASRRDVAESYLNEILDAIQPGTPPARATTLAWVDAPKGQQPIRPVFPGVQFALGDN